MYSHAESSLANSAVQTKTSSGQEKKNDEARDERERCERRRSVSSERTLVSEQTPPRYEDVVRHDTRRA
jgi:hypothetical protein